MKLNWNGQLGFLLLHYIVRLFLHHFLANEERGNLEAYDIHIAEVERSRAAAEGSFHVCSMPRSQELEQGRLPICIWKRSATCIKHLAAFYLMQCVMQCARARIPASACSCPLSEAVLFGGGENVNNYMTCTTL